MEFPVFHKSLDTLHYGTEKPRAYFIPYRDENTAAEGLREKSDFLTDLNGEWRFRFYDSFEDVGDDFYAEGYDISDLHAVPVPGCWQLYGIDGTDVPLYSNLKYPFPTDPPHVPDRNPAAAFIRDFEITDDGERDLIITFEGVSSCFYLFVNGSFAGYSQISHSTSEFDITHLTRKGGNRIAVLVVKWCDGSYLEDQDFFRLSGIFRDVYILSRSKNRIEDVFIKQRFGSGYSYVCLDVECDMKGSTDINYVLYSPEGKAAASAKGCPGTFSIRVDSPEMWNDEEPFVYKLILECSGEFIPFEVAVREVKTEGKKLLVNGRAVKLRGINRHDSSPDKGYTVSESEMMRDLYLMKRANVNAIRTSHYPNDPRFPLMAQRLGFYLIDEADLETHGMGFDTDEHWDWMRWSLLSSSDEWEQAYVDRAAHLFERDKNTGAVIMWSLGNESGCGKNHRAMRKYIKDRDSGAIVHYENAHLQFTAVPEGENFSDISDVESRMYPGYAYTKEYLENEEYTKPFYMCEYVCSTTTGDVYDFWDLVDRYDNFCGGCIWEWCDHSVSIPGPDGKPRYYYGGDFGEFPNDSICCIDGLVFPDRSPRPGYYDMKKVYEPFRGSYKDGRLTVKNVRYFTQLDDLYAEWSVECDGETVISGRTDCLDIEPQGEKEFELFDPSGIALKGNSFLTVSLKRKDSCEWAQTGYETGFLQFELESEKSGISACGTPLAVTEHDGKVSVECGKARYVFDKRYGKLTGIGWDGREMLTAPCEYSLWHAPTYNRGSADAWEANHFDHAVQKTYSVSTEMKNGEFVITAQTAVGGPSNPPVVRTETVYRFREDGSAEISIKGDIRENVPVLPRFGLEMYLDKENEYITWLGLGPTESYPDRNRACRFGKWESTVTENFVHYIRPQENSSHFGTRSLTVGNGSTGIVVNPCGMKDFSFNASHYSSGQLTEKAHDFELEEENMTIVNLDGRFNAISEYAELDNDENNRLFDEKSFSFGFRIQPFGP